MPATFCMLIGANVLPPSVDFSTTYSRALGSSGVLHSIVISSSSVASPFNHRLTMNSLLPSITSTLSRPPVVFFVSIDVLLTEGHLPLNDKYNQYRLPSSERSAICRIPFDK